MSRDQTPAGVQITGGMTPEYAEILSADALAFLAKLHRSFNARRLELLQRRAARQAELDAGQMPAFLAHTQATRDADWKVAPVPADLQDRRVEITGPTDRKMVINALNSGANMFMADFEDSNTPTWDNQVQGQINLRDAVRRRDRLRQPGRQALSAQRQDRHPAGAPARLASGREAPAGRRRSRCRARCSISACTSSTTSRSGSSDARAPTSICPRWRAIWKRACGTTSSCWRRTSSACPQGSVKATVLIETILGGVRDGRDPLRAARALGGAQLRALGLHLLLHQEAARQARFHPGRSRPGHHDLALHARVFAAADQDLPPPRRLRHGRYGRADPDQERPGCQRAGHRQGAHGQGARGQRRARRHLGRAPRAGADCEGSVRQGHEDPEPDPASARRRRRQRRPTCSTSSPRDRSPSRGCA